ncbi:MAG: YhjD/YihY/BrkB family envelope integrity protein, partial [Chthoniobacterales bacterium]
AGLRGFAVSERSVLLGGVVTGPLFGWFGQQWRTRGAIAGALVTAALFEAGELLIGIYLGRSGIAARYGTGGSVLLVLLWIYYSSLILFFGAELTQVYETGSGTLKLRGEWKIEERKGGVQAIVLTSLPYGVVRGALVERIAEIITGRKLAALVDVRDESTAEVRVVLETK